MTRSKFQLAFLLLAALLPLPFRAWLAWTRRDGLGDLGGAGLVEMFWIGQRLDAVVAALLTAPACLALLLVPGRALRATLQAARAWAFLVFLALAGAELAGLEFFAFYDFRPNHLVLDHAGDREVLRTIAAAYPVTSVVLASLAIAVVATLLLGRAARSPRSGAIDRLAMVLVLGLTFLAARGTLDHRAVNPSLASFSSNRLANEIAGSGIYNVVYEAVQRRKDHYGAVETCLEPLPYDEAVDAVRERLAGTGSFVDGGENPLLRDVEGPPRPSRPRNVVVVVLESFTARLIGHLGGELALSPELDRLAAEGVAFTRCHATGERTIQGLEAILSSFPPLPGVAALRRPETRSGFDTLATVLRRAGHGTSFVYGGQGIFDQMRGFFVANDYETFVEEEDYEDPVFVGDWGVSDEDLYRRVVREADRLHAEGKPFFVTALTVSLHSPWQYPDGRIEELPADVRVPDGFEREELNTFLYADHALGAFVEDARDEPWFDETLFVFVGDHGVHLRGRLSVPVEEYRVAAVLYAPKHLAPARIDRVTSQLDIAPTILGLLGGRHRSTFFGEDVLANPDGEGFAPMVYRKERYAVVSGDRVTLARKKGREFEARHADGTSDGSSPVDASEEHARDFRFLRGFLQTAERLLQEGAYRSSPPPSG